MLPLESQVVLGDPTRAAFGLASVRPGDGPNYRRVNAWLGGHCLTEFDDLVYVPSFCPRVRQERERLSRDTDWPHLPESMTDSELFENVGEVSWQVMAYDVSVFRSLVFFCFRGNSGRLVYRLADAPSHVGGVSIERAELRSLVGELERLVCGSWSRRDC